MKLRRLTAVLLALLLALGMFPAASAAASKDLYDCYMLLDGKDWNIFTLEARDETHTTEELREIVEVLDAEDNPVPKDAYDLVVGTYPWDEEKQANVFTEISAPFGLTCDPDYMQAGFGDFAVYAVARENSGYTGATVPQSFMLWHKYSLNYFGAQIDFGEDYKSDSRWFWHDYYEIPENGVHEPAVYDIEGERVDPALYTLTYYVRNTEIPDFDDPEYESKIYPDTEPLDGMPTERGAYYVRVEGKEPYYGSGCVDFDIVEPKDDDDPDFRVLLDGEDWTIFPIEEKTGFLWQNDMKITVIDREGETLPEDAYDIFVCMTEWDDEAQMDLYTAVQEPYTLACNDDFLQAGFGEFAVQAYLKEDSGYEGRVAEARFMLWHKYSLNYFGAQIDFGEDYKSDSRWFWHDYYEIPENGVHEPAVYDISGEEIDPALYTLTYYVRNTEIPDFDDPEYESKIYPDTEPLDGMPTERGAYYVRVEGKEPYYGSGCVDFDIVEEREPELFAFVRGSERRYHDGDTIYIPEGGEVYIGFDVDPYTGDIPGWRNDLLEEQGFTIDEDPTFFDGDDFAYAHVTAGDLPAGSKGTLYCNWYSFEDIFIKGIPWDEAPIRMSSSVDICIGEEPAPSGFIIGDADRSGEVASDDIVAIQRWLIDLPTDAKIGDDGVYGTYFAAWNIRERLLPADSPLEGAARAEAEAEIRSALDLLVDRREISGMIGTERRAASSIVANYITDADGSPFISNATDQEYDGYFDAYGFDAERDEALAVLKKYYDFDEASGTFMNVPALRYLCNEGWAHEALAGWIQRSYAEYGITLEIYAVSWDDYFDALAEGNYTLARDGWVIDTDDPLEFLTMWTSDSEDNIVGFGCGNHAQERVYSLDLRPCSINYHAENASWTETYDVLIDYIRAEKDTALRYRLMHLAEDMVMQSGCILPMYYY